MEDNYVQLIKNFGFFVANKNHDRWNAHNGLMRWRGTIKIDKLHEQKKLHFLLKKRRI